MDLKGEEMESEGGGNPLHIASFLGNDECVKILLSHVGGYSDKQRERL